jgi:hypothetical protein
MLGTGEGMIVYGYVGGDQSIGNIREPVMLLEHAVANMT